MRLKKKYAMAWGVLAVGAVLAFMRPEVIGSWTALSGLVLGIFSTSDVADKRLNGGQY